MAGRGGSARPPSPWELRVTAAEERKCDESNKVSGCDCAAAAASYGAPQRTKHIMWLQVVRRYITSVRVFHIWNIYLFHGLLVVFVLWS